MTEVSKVQIEFLKQNLELMNEGNFEALKEISFKLIERLEKSLSTDHYFSFPSDAEITKFVSLPENQNKHQDLPRAKAFVNGAIWMREIIDVILKS